jgi:hypothetical protein
MQKMFGIFGSAQQPLPVLRLPTAVTELNKTNRRKADKSVNEALFTLNTLHPLLISY